MNEYKISAYAKINLGLDVVSKLPNGYHEVKMIMQTVDICDDLLLTKIPEGIVITTDAGELPTDGDNLIYKAAQKMKERYRIAEGVKIHLTKRIPIAAGMAGGSTDAAATLKGMKELFAPEASVQELMEIGVTIGADVPYCVLGGTALAEGIGEKLTPLPAAPDCILLVAKPDINVSTKYVYEHLDALETYHHPDIDGMVQAVLRGDTDGIVARLENVLEQVTIPAHPVVREIKELMNRCGASGSLMSGSGPTVFGIFENRQQAESAAQQIRDRQLSGQIFVTHFKG